MPSCTNLAELPTLTSKQTEGRLFDAHLGAEDIALVVVKALHQSRVVPALNVVVWAIMDFHLNGVTTIIDQEDDGVQPIPDHGGHILQ